MEHEPITIVGDSTKARFISAMLDNVIALVLTIVIVSFVPENSSTTRVALLFMVYLGYYFILESVWGRTLGKYFQGLIVRKLNRARGDWKTAFIRTLLRVVEVNPVLFGAIPAGLVLISSERKQRLGDMLAGSVVVSDKLKWNAEKHQE